jgi:hypothetical protein
MKKHFWLSMMITTLTVFLFLTGCKKSETTQLSLSSLMAGDIDLNGATAPNNVPVNPTITAVFSTDVDASSATAANIMLMQDYDNSMIDLNITTSGNTITIEPASPLGNGALYKLSFGSGLIAANGTALTAIDRSFTTEGTFVPAGQIAYWNFEDNANDQVGNFSPESSGITAITYTASRSTEAGKAATFDGATSLIEIPNGDQLSNTSDFSLCFWVNADSTKHGQYVMGLSAWYGFQFEIAGDYGSCKLAAQYDFGDGTSGSEDLWFAGDGQTRDNGGWQGWTFCKDLSSSGGVQALLASKWAQVVCVYNSASKVGTMYINGEEMKAQDFDLWPDGDPKQGVVGLKFAGNPGNNAFVFGFIQDKNDPTVTDTWADYSNPDNNHFKGQLDDVRIFHKALTATEVMLMYNSEKP